MDKVLHKIGNLLKWMTGNGHCTFRISMTIIIFHRRIRKLPKKVIQNLFIFRSKLHLNAKCLDVEMSLAKRVTKINYWRDSSFENPMVFVFFSLGILWCTALDEFEWEIYEADSRMDFRFVSLELHTPFSIQCISFNISKKSRRVLRLMMAAKKKTCLPTS